MDVSGRRTSNDAELRARARAVIPGGMYGHQSARSLPDGFPQFLTHGEGARIWDVDGNEYVDFMCSYGPIVLGHHDERVDGAIRAASKGRRADCQNGPSPVMIELAERLVEVVDHADWAMFAKNGTDATTMCVTIARSATGRRKVLVAEGAYHGAAPWCTPLPTGTTPEDRAHLDRFRFNDLESVEAAVARCDGDLAAIVVSPFRHDARFDQELVDPAWAAALRRICDDTGAALVLDDVRCGFRLAFGGSWEPIGVRPDLSAWSKAIANGQPLAAVLGNDRFRDGAERIYVTGSFWFAAVPMAASLATIDALEEDDAVLHMERMGLLLRAGLEDQAASYGLSIVQSGPPQMPFLSFVADTAFERANVFTGTAARHGAYLHPWHNWFLCAAHTPEDIADALVATDSGFAAVRATFGGD